MELQNNQVFQIVFKNVDQPALSMIATVSTDNQDRPLQQFLLEQKNIFEKTYGAKMTHCLNFAKQALEIKDLKRPLSKALALTPIHFTSSSKVGKITMHRSNDPREKKIMTLPFNCSVQQLYACVGNQLQTAINHFDLFCGRAILEYDNESLLSDMGIAINEDTIIEYQFRNQGQATIRCADFSKEGNMVKSLWSATAPKWRIACQGLNALGKCLNSSCQASNKEVICMLQNLQNFDVLEQKEEIRCPICNNKFNPTTFGFSNCWYSWKGIKYKGGFWSQVSSSKKIKVGDYFQYQKGTNEDDSADWKSLIFYIDRSDNDEDFDEVQIDTSHDCCWCTKQKPSKMIQHPKCSQNNHWIHQCCLEEQNANDNTENQCLDCSINDMI